MQMHEIADDLSVKKVGVDIAGLTERYKDAEPQEFIVLDIRSIARKFTEVCDEIDWKLKEAQRRLDPQYAPERITLNIDALIARRYELYQSLERNFDLLRAMRG